MSILNEIKNKVYLPIALALGLGGCQYTNDNTVEISNRTLDGQIEEHCFQEFEDSFGSFVEEPTECILDAIAEAIGEDMPDNVYFTIVDPDDGNWNRDDLGTNGVVGGKTYVAVVPQVLSGLMETTFHEFGHSMQPGDSAYGNHLNAEFFTTYFGFNLLKVMENSPGIYNYDHAPNIGFFSLCPIIFTPWDIYEERDWLYSDSVCDTNLGSGAYRYNKDFVPAQTIVNQLIAVYDGNLEDVRLYIEDASYYQEYTDLRNDYKDDCDAEKLDEIFYEDRADARNAITEYVHTELPEMSFFWDEYETSYTGDEE